jgi:hypothetical protein
MGVPHKFNQVLMKFFANIRLIRNDIFLLAGIQGQIVEF